VYSALHVRPTYQFLLSYDYRLLSYESYSFVGSYRPSRLSKDNLL